jgi:hypothetical protein
MMPDTVPPRAAGESPEHVRSEWLAEIGRFMTEVEQWAERHGWATLRDDRTVTEDELGTYQVPVLLVHTMKGRLLLTPEARYLLDADGLIELSVYPSFETSVQIVKTSDGWRLKYPDREELGEPWSEDSFARTVKALFDPT